MDERALAERLIVVRHLHPGRCAQRRVLRPGLARIARHRASRCATSTACPCILADGRPAGRPDRGPARPHRRRPGARRAVRAADRGRPADRPRRLRHEGRARGDDVRARRRRAPGRGPRPSSSACPTRRARTSSTARPTRSSPRASRATSRSPASRPTCTSASRPRACSRSALAVHGTAAHGSTPWLGDNAILKAHDVFRRIETLPFSRESSELFDRPSINLARIAGRRRVQQGPRPLRDRRRHPLSPQPGPGGDPRPDPRDRRSRRSSSASPRAPAIVLADEPVRPRAA